MGVFCWIFKLTFFSATQNNESPKHK